MANVEIGRARVDFLAAEASRAAAEAAATERRDGGLRAAAAERKVNTETAGQGWKRADKSLAEARERLQAFGLAALLADAPRASEQAGEAEPLLLAAAGSAEDALNALKRAARGVELCRFAAGNLERTLRAAQIVGAGIGLLALFLAVAGFHRLRALLRLGSGAIAGPWYWLLVAGALVAGVGLYLLGDATARRRRSQAAAIKLWTERGEPEDRTWWPNPADDGLSAGEFLMDGYFRPVVEVLRNVPWADIRAEAGAWLAAAARWAWRWVKLGGAKALAGLGTGGREVGQAALYGLSKALVTLAAAALRAGRALGRLAARGVVSGRRWWAERQARGAAGQKGG